MNKSIQHTIKILHLEDTPTDAELVERELKKGNIQFEKLIVDNKTDYEKALTDFSPDIILSDHSLPSFDSILALKIVKARNINIPFILITSSVNEEFAVTIMKEGASDYVLKDRLQRLPAAIANSLEKYNLELEKHKFNELLIVNEKRYRSLIEKSSDMVTILSGEGLIQYCSQSVEKILGYSTEEFKLKNAVELIHPDDIAVFAEGRKELLKTPGQTFNTSLRIKHKNGQWRWIETALTNMLEEPAIYGLVANFKDISDKKIAEQIREFDRNNLNALINNTKDLMWSVNTDLNLITSNNQFDEMVKFMTGKSITKGESVLSVGFSEDQITRFKSYYQRALKGETFTVLEYSQIPDDYWSEISFNPIYKDNKVIGTACKAHDITQTKITEANLHLSKSRLIEAQALSKIGNWETDLKTLKVIWSAETYRIFGCQPEDFSSSHPDFLKFVHPDDLKRVSDAFDTSYQSKSVNIIEHRIITPSGEIKHVEERWRIVFSDEGQAIRAMGTSQDITERKIGEEKLKKSEALLSESQRLAHLGNWMVDFKTEKAIWSEETCRIYGIPADENIHEYSDLIAFVHPEDKENVMTTINDAMQTHGDTELNHRIVLKDGTVKHVYSKTRFEFDETGLPSGLYGITLDVTTRKKTELLLQKSEAFSIGVLNSLSAHIAVIDKEGVIIAVNESWKRFGAENGETSFKRINVYSNYFDVCAKSSDEGIEDATIVLKAMHDIIDGTINDFYFEYPCHSPNELRWFGLTLRKFESDNSLMVVSHQNISERKLVELERTKITEDLTQRNNDLEQFAYIISHNLRGPVVNIMGISTAMEDLSNDEENKLILNNALNKSVAKLDEVVKDLNHILQVKREINETKELVFLPNLVEDIKISIANLIDKNNVTIQCNFSEVSEFTTIKSYIYSIFYNLIINSIKFKQPNIQPIIKIKSSLQNGQMVLTFKDNGLGIDLNKKGVQVFGLYKRFHANIEGKGMGLFMVKTQVESLGGKINISSKVNIGTEFTLVF
ncbi:MAG: PAS domain-containing protein [Bacteroidota bacterium]